MIWKTQRHKYKRTYKYFALFYFSLTDCR